MTEIEKIEKIVEFGIPITKANFKAIDELYDLVNGASELAVAPNSNYTTVDDLVFHLMRAIGYLETPIVISRPYEPDFENALIKVLDEYNENDVVLDAETINKEVQNLLNDYRIDSDHVVISVTELSDTLTYLIRGLLGILDKRFTNL